MRNYYFIMAIGLCFIFSVSANAQQPKEKTVQIAMLKFLFNQKELTNPQDTTPSNLDVMFKRAVLINNVPARPGTVYVFGTYSPHGKHFIGLIDHSGINLLETNELPNDMQTIIAFFKRNNVNAQRGYKCLNVIAETYQYNGKRNFRPAVEKK